MYPAEATLMGFFARPNRYLTQGTRVMIHARKLSREPKLEGPLTTCVAGVKALLHEIETSITIQNEGFAAPVRGSRVGAHGGGLRLRTRRRRLQGLEV